jgi:hypothetical protein
MNISTVLIILSLLVPTISSAQGNLLILPKRIIFDGSKRTQNLNLVNTGNDTATYTISLIQIRMKEEGTFENITEPDPGQYFASKYLRIFPRSVTLAPKESQTVKVQVIQSSGLTPGEYRSHIYFRAAPPVTPAGQKGPAADSANLSVKMVPVFGISIPVIIQAGTNSSTAGMSAVRLVLSNKEKPELNMYLERTGNMSVYGDLQIDYISPMGVKTRVGAVNGVAVYTPLPRRKIKINLQAIPAVDYHKGKLYIAYSLPTTAKAVMLTEQELTLQ